MTSHPVPMRGGDEHDDKVIERENIQRGRAVCPACGRKGLGYAAHPHAFGYKDYERAVCRYCKKKFRKAAKADTKEEA